VEIQGWGPSQESAMLRNSASAGVFFGGKLLFFLPVKGFECEDSSNAQLGGSSVAQLRRKVDVI
jgi:hypothetical protein